MPKGGKLTIATENELVDREAATILGEIMPGRYVSLALTDTGTGMPPDVLARVFEPFFTTKEVGKGSGLGLSQVYGFARQSEGHIAITSDVGKGTTVRLYLPWIEWADSCPNGSARCAATAWREYIWRAGSSVPGEAPRGYQARVCAR